MEILKNNDKVNKFEKNENINNNENTFERICKIQKLIKKESALKELCKILLYYEIEIKTLKL